MVINNYHITELQSIYNIKVECQIAALHEPINLIKISKLAPFVA